MAKSKSKQTGRKATRAVTGKRGSPPRARGSTPRPPPTRTNRIRALATRNPKSLIDRMEQVQDALSAELGRQVGLSMTSPKTQARTPWSVVGRFTNLNTDYMTLSEVLGRLEDKLTRRLGGRRLARAKITYRGVKRKGRRERDRREWTLGEITSLDTLIPRAQNALIDAWARYGTGGSSLPEGSAPSTAVELELWLADESATDTGVF